MSGTLPMSDSPTPTIATLFLERSSVWPRTSIRAARSNCGSIAPSPRSSNVTLDAVADRDVERIVADDVREHARTVVEVDQRDDVGRVCREGRVGARWTMLKL